MNNVYFYEVNVNWEEQRKGSIASPSLETNTVATPPEFLKGHAGIWSPEHYFVASISSYLMTTFLAVAENSKFESFECKATGKLEKVDGKFMISEVELVPKIVIGNDSDKEKAHKVLEKSEAACLISNSVKSRIAFKPLVSVAV